MRFALFAFTLTEPEHDGPRVQSSPGPGIALRNAVVLPRTLYGYDPVE